MENYIVYVKTDTKNRIIDINSSAFVSTDWGIQIDQGIGDRYHHAQRNYFPLPLYTEDGVPCYKLVAGMPVERLESEIQADRKDLQKAEPTDTDVLNTLLGVI